MDVRDSTKVKYINFLTKVREQTGVFNLKTLVVEHQIDFKIFGFLRLQETGIMRLVDKESVEVITNFSPQLLMEEYLKYRTKVNIKSKERAAKLKLLDNNEVSIIQAHYTNEKTVFTAEEVNKLIANTKIQIRKEIAKDAAEYAEWAVSKGKSNIAEVVLKMLSL